MGLGILIGTIAVVMINAYVTDLIEGSFTKPSRVRLKLLVITWLIPFLGALYSIVNLNSDKFKEQEALKQQQKADLTAWNLQSLHSQTEVTLGENSDDGGD